MSKNLMDYSPKELRQKLQNAKTPRDEFNYAVALIDKCYSVMTNLHISDIELDIEIIDKKLKSNSLPPEKREELLGKKRRMRAMLDRLNY
jgi:hypothetical protein